MAVIDVQVNLTLEGQTDGLPLDAAAEEVVMQHLGADLNGNVLVVDGSTFTVTVEAMWRN